MTKIEFALWNFIKDYCEKNGFSPSYEEIKDGIGYKSKGHVFKIITGLVRDGFLIKSKTRSRGLWVSRVDEVLAHTQKNESIDYKLLSQSQETIIKQQQKLIDQLKETIENQKLLS